MIRITWETIRRYTDYHAPFAVVFSREEEWLSEVLLPPEEEEVLSLLGNISFMEVAVGLLNLLACGVVKS